MITMIVAGGAVLAVVSVVVVIVDRVKAATWRQVAAERRQAWEGRRQVLIGSGGTDSWGDQDD